MINLLYTKTHRYPSRQMDASECVVCTDGKS